MIPSNPPLPRCPTCDAPVDPATTPTMPFCSARCRQVDLGRWLDERFSLPIERDQEDGDAEGFENNN